MRIALVIASLVLAAPAANACPPPVNYPYWHGPVAVAFAAASEQRGLATTIDDAGFGGDWPAGSVGVLVVGSSVRYPLGPLPGMSSDAVRGKSGAGDLVDASDLAIAELERSDIRMRALYLVGEVDMSTFEKIRERGWRSGVDVFVWVGRYGRAAKDVPAIVETPPLAPADPAPADPPRWPAVALLIAAAALSRRVTG